MPLSWPAPSPALTSWTAAWEIRPPTVTLRASGWSGMRVGVGESRLCVSTAVGTVRGCVAVPADSPDRCPARHGAHAPCSDCRSFSALGPRRCAGLPGGLRAPVDAILLRRWSDCLSRRRQVHLHLVGAWVAAMMSLKYARRPIRSVNSLSRRWQYRPFRSSCAAATAATTLAPAPTSATAAQVPCSRFRAPRVAGVTLTCSFVPVRMSRLRSCSC